MRTAPPSVIMMSSGALPSLRGLVTRSALLGGAALLPAVDLCIAAGRLDIARGLAVGLILGVLNSLLLAQHLDRMISGATGVDRLRRSFRTNRNLRFALVLGCSAMATQARGIHMVGLVVGLAFFFALSTVVYCRGVLQRWQREEGQAA